MPGCLVTLRKSNFGTPDFTDIEKVCYIYTESVPQLGEQFSIKCERTGSCADGRVAHVAWGLEKIERHYGHHDDEGYDVLTVVLVIDPAQTQDISCPIALLD